MAAVGVAGGSGAAVAAGKIEIAPAILPLPEGKVTLQLPYGLSPRSVAALEAWLKIMIDLAKANEVPREAAQ